MLPEEAMTPWFYVTLFIMSLLCGSFALYYYRKHQNQRQILEQKQKELSAALQHLPKDPWLAKERRSYLENRLCTLATALKIKDGP